MKLADKQSIFQQIYNNCEHCLIAPENPFTLDNPDLIAANRDKLFAVFLPSYREQNDPDHLLRRLYLSQLSYGHKMSTVLLLLDNERQNGSINYSVLEMAFSHLSESIEDVIKIINGALPNYKRWKDFSEIQTTQYINYRIFTELSLTSFNDKGSDGSNDERFERVTGIDRVETHSWYHDRWKESKDFWHTQNGLVGNVMKSPRASFKSVMDYIMTTAFMTLFNFDNGVIYPSGYYNELNIINTNWQLFNEDCTPNQYNRMLSFLGLTPVWLSSSQDFGRLVSNYQRIRSNVIGE